MNSNNVFLPQPETGVNYGKNKKIEYVELMRLGSAHVLVGVCTDGTGIELASFGEGNNQVIGGYLAAIAQTLNSVAKMGDVLPARNFPWVKCVKKQF